MPRQAKPTRRSKKHGPPRGTGSRQVYETLRRKILTLELRPGASLDESMLVEMLGISRTPVREALIRLSAEDLVVLLPNRGAHVAPLDMDHVREFFEAMDVSQRTVNYWSALRRRDDELAAIHDAMLAFESAAAQRDADAMIETNRQFHAVIATTCRNAYVGEGYCRLLTQGLRLSRLSFSYDFAYDADKSLARHIDFVIGEHRMMEKAIRERDPVGAEKLASAHVRLALARLNHMMSAGLRHDMEVVDYSRLPRAPQRAPAAPRAAEPARRKAG